MKIGGLQKVSLIDYPERISAVVFTQGCNFRCPYCHNPGLVPPNPSEVLIPEEGVLSFLQKRRERLDGVTISGGEPTIQADLGLFLKKVRALGFPVKLDTNGSAPELLKDLLSEGLLDYVAMDVKAPPEKYGKLSGSAIPFPRIRKSADILRASGVPYEFRTTMVPSLLNEGDLSRLLDAIGPAAGPAGRFVLQRFIPSQTLDPSLTDERESDLGELRNLAKELSRRGGGVLVR